MTSPEIKILITLAGLALVHAFICDIRLSRNAARLADKLRDAYPDTWSELNPVARNWNGGYPAIKLLKRRNLVHLPGFDREYQELRTLEKRFLPSLATGVVCLGALIPGFLFLGWAW